MHVKHLAVCVFLFANPIKAQIIPSELLNDTRTFEVTACMPSNNKIVTAWMERRPSRQDNSESAKDMRVGYRFSPNRGKDWSVKGVIDLPNTFGTGNPYLACNRKGETFLAVMHIGNDFYSGNISLYEFDFRSKNFKLKSIPVKTDSLLFDKPAIAVHGNEIHLLYIAYGKRVKNSLKYQMSKNKGKTWSQPVKIPIGSNVPYLGPSLALVDGKELMVSCGSYGRNNVYVTRKKNNADSIVFEDPVIVSRVSSGMRGAMTELTIDQSDRLILSWQDPHQPYEIWLSHSKDNGATWMTPLSLTSKGNLLSAVFDYSGRIHCIYSDFTDSKFRVLYKLIADDNKIITEKRLTHDTPLEQLNEYLGAFQKLLVQRDELFAFWIDYPNCSALRFSRWKITGK